MRKKILVHDILKKRITCVKNNVEMFQIILPSKKIVQLLKKSELLDHFQACVMQFFENDRLRLRAKRELLYY